MVIKNEPFLAFVRTLPCAFCGAPPPSQAAHCMPRGHGGGSRLDVPLNVLPCCFEDHGKYEGDREAMFGKVAERNGLESWTVAQEACWRLLRTRSRKGVG